ncbi:helix-turn-helix transcriptional regulator [Streptomyces sp. NPDC046915]|uniref:helix-turn-helix domain-containing protein n=1 Tax=Streptomyces sp. NPDC046915 TaxID=3155257 RepID=UPI00340832EE
MTRWRSLPDALPGEVRHLVGQLRVLKDRTGLSLAELARRTAYSKSSWQRYLSGTKLPPWAAVQALGRLAGGEPARLLVLWELADQAWTPPEAAMPAGPAEPSEDEAFATGPEPPGGGRGRWRTAALVAFAVIVLLVAGLLWVLPRGSDDRTAGRPRDRSELSRAGRSRRSSRDRCP